MRIYRETLLSALQVAIKAEEKRLNKKYGKDFVPVYLSVWNLLYVAIKEGQGIAFKD